MPTRTMFCLFLLMGIVFWQPTNSGLLAQSPEKTYLDTLLIELALAKSDSNKVYLLHDVAFEYMNINEALSNQYAQQGLELAQQLNWDVGKAMHLWIIGRVYWKTGQYEKARQEHEKAFRIYEKKGDKYGMAYIQQSIGQDYADEGKYTEALAYFDLSLQNSIDINDKETQAGIYNLKSWVYGNLGNSVEALENDYKSLRIYEEIGDTYGIVIANSNIAETLSEEGRYEEAIALEQKSIAIYDSIGDLENTCGAYLSIGYFYLLQNKYEEALENNLLGMEIAEKMDDQDLIAKATRGIGEIYEAQQNLEAALDMYFRAVAINRKTGDKQNLADLCIQIANIYVRLQQYQLADRYFQEAYPLSKELGSLNLLSSYHNSMFNRHNQVGNWKEALTNYQQYIVYKDSLYNEDVTEKLVQAKMRYEFDQKELANKTVQATKDQFAANALARQMWIRNLVTGGLLLLLLFTLILVRQRNNIAREKKRSDDLLLNILPAETAEELKRYGATKAQSFDEVTVMFTDFKNFTAISEQMSPQDLVNEINYCYSAFDNIITKHGIEKIKTIGDSYMCAGGLPAANTTHAEDVVRAALEIRDFMLEEQKRRQAEGKIFFEVRIGCNTGPVVAGIVGIKKFAYDIWGDTVNLAARMESSCDVSKVNISDSTYALVKDKFSCSYRGKLEAKNKGIIDMYFAESLDMEHESSIAV